MDHPIKRDHSRFRKIVKGKIRDSLKKYVSNGEMPIQKGSGSYKVPMPRIETPRFKFGQSSKVNLAKEMERRVIRLSKKGNHKKAMKKLEMEREVKS